MTAFIAVRCLHAHRDHIVKRSKMEALLKVILFGARSLLWVLGRYVVQHHEERPH